MNNKLITCTCIFAVSLGCYVLDYTLGVIICELLLSVYIVWVDFSKGIKNATLLSFYSLFSCLYIIGNFMVAYSVDTAFEGEYNYYLSKEHILDGCMLSFIGHFGFITGYLAYEEKGDSGFKMDGIIPQSYLLPIIGVSIAYNIFSLSTGWDYQLIDSIAYPFLFLFVKSAANKNKSNWMNYAVLLVCLISFRGILYSYRRQSALEPFLIFFISLAISYSGKLKEIFSFKYLTMFICFLFLISQFSTMGKIRSLSGQARLDQWSSIYESSEESEEEQEYALDPFDTEKENPPLARASTLNQLSQVARLHTENGNYGGSTLTYLGFAFIPRFLWPEKPLIMQGRWFAMEAGLAYNHGTTKSLQDVNNSINMTAAGELYLNFGFIGTFIGMLVIAFILKQGWEMCNFYDERNNFTGSVFGIYLIVVSYFYLQVDLQFLVSMLQVFLTVWLLNFIIVNFLAKSDESLSN